MGPILCFLVDQERNSCKVMKVSIPTAAFHFLFHTFNIWPSSWRVLSGSCSYSWYFCLLSVAHEYEIKADCPRAYFSKTVDKLLINGYLLSINFSHRYYRHKNIWTRAQFFFQFPSVLKSLGNNNCFWHVSLEERRLRIYFRILTIYDFKL